MKFELGAYSVVFETGGSFPASRPVYFTQAIERTAGGTLRVENLGVKYERREINFVASSQTDYANMKSFIEDVADGSANSFLFTDEKGTVNTVQIVSATFDLAEQEYESYYGTIIVEII